MFEMNLIFLLFICAARISQCYNVKLIVGQEFPQQLPLTMFQSRVAAIDTDLPLVFVVGDDYGPCFKNASLLLGSEAYTVVYFDVLPTPILCVSGNRGVQNAVNSSTTVNRGLLFGAYQVFVYVANVF